MKFLIAGLGSIGRRHLNNLLQLGEQDIVLYRTGQSTLPPAELESAGHQFPVETNLAAALSHRPDAVIISNPTALHLEVAIPAAQAGCHLLLEKPVSHSLAGIPDLSRALQSSGGQTLVGFQFRYHPGLQKIAEILAAGAIGRPLSVQAHWGEFLPGWHPWEDYRQGYSARPELGGGVVLTLCHPLDYLRWLIGEIEAVWAFTGRTSDLELLVEDTAEIGLRFANGALGTVHLDYNQRPPSHHLEIIGTQGTIAWKASNGQVSVFQAGSSDWSQYPAPPGFERNDLFLAQMAHFREVIAGRSAPRCSLQDGVRALEIALAVLDSQAKGELIRLPDPAQRSY
jgi:predicted dehydrogenase